MNDADRKKVVEVLKNRDNFLITAHVNPEGDSIGSQLAVLSLLKKLGKEAAIVNHDEVPDNLRFLPGCGNILPEFPGDFDIETAVILDCPVKERASTRVAKLIDSAKLIVNIDHHVSNEFFGDVNWVESRASSVGEMVFHLIKDLGVEVDVDLATVLYTAIVTDTGLFSYDNTSKGTHEVIGQLMDGGARPNVIHTEVFEKKSLAQIRLLGKALTTVELEEKGRVAYMSLTRKMYKEENVESVSTEEFINYARSIKGVEVAVFFKESFARPGTINVSFRSSGSVNVNAVASHFGGGGHEKASGCIMECGLDEARERILAEVRKVLGDK